MISSSQQLLNTPNSLNIVYTMWFTKNTQKSFINHLKVKDNPMVI